MFRIGQKVVCVDIFESIDRAEITPVKGEIYTIRDSFIHEEGDAVVRLLEIVNAPKKYKVAFRECCFYAHYFRPVDETFGTEVAEKIESEFINQPEPALV